MVRTITCIFIVFMLFIPCIMADIAIEGISPYNINYNLTNAGMYPDYVILTSSEIRGWDSPAIIQNGIFGGGYKLDGFIIHAIKKDMINVTMFNTLNQLNLDPNQGENENLLNISEYMALTPIVTANLSLPVSEYYNDDLNIKNVSVNLLISNMSDSEFKISRDNVIFGYKNGKTVVMELDENEELIPPPEP